MQLSLTSQLQGEFPNFLRLFFVLGGEGVTNYGAHSTPMQCTCACTTPAGLPVETHARKRTLPLHSVHIRELEYQVSRLCAQFGLAALSFVPPLSAALHAGPREPLLPGEKPSKTVAGSVSEV